MVSEVSFPQRASYSFQNLERIRLFLARDIFAQWTFCCVGFEQLSQGLCALPKTGDNLEMFELCNQLCRIVLKRECMRSAFTSILLKYEKQLRWFCSVLGQRDWRFMNCGTSVVFFRLRTATSAMSHKFSR